MAKSTPAKKVNKNTELEKIEKIQSLIAEAHASDIPKLYFNGFATQIGNSDVLIVLQNNQKPVAVLNASFTIAKTLVQKLNGVIGFVESASGNNIMTTEDVTRFLNASHEKKNKE